MSMGSQPVAMLAGKHLRDYALTPLMIRIWYGKHPYFSTKPSFSTIRTEKRPFSVRIRVRSYTAGIQTMPKHVSSNSTNNY